MGEVKFFEVSEYIEYGTSRMTGILIYVRDLSSKLSELKQMMFQGGTLQWVNFCDDNTIGLVIEDQYGQKFSLCFSGSILHSLMKIDENEQIVISFSERPFVDDYMLRGPSCISDYVAFSVHWYGVDNSVKKLFVGYVEHITLICGKCSAKIRTPKGKGTVVVTCPKCMAKTSIWT